MNSFYVWLKVCEPSNYIIGVDDETISNWLEFSTRSSIFWTETISVKMFRQCSFPFLLVWIHDINIRTHFHKGTDSAEKCHQDLGSCNNKGRQFVVTRIIIIVRQGKQQVNIEYYLLATCQSHLHASKNSKVKGIYNKVIHLPLTR